MTTTPHPTPATNAEWPYRPDEEKTVYPPARWQPYTDFYIAPAFTLRVWASPDGPNRWHLFHCGVRVGAYESESRMRRGVRHHLTKHGATPHPGVTL